MLDAPYRYIVRYWIAPAAKPRVMEWLDGGHMAEVVAQPGFRWARRIRLDEVDSLGWRAFTNFYGLESKAALDAYVKDPVRQRYAEEQKPLAGQMRVERSRGGSEFLAVR